MKPDTLTARAARWSAAHRKAAVLGWFAFVLVTFAVGSAAGFVFMKDEEFGIGDSHEAEALLSREFAPLDVRRFRPYVESNARFLLLLAVRQGNWVVRALERDGRALEPYPNADGLLLYEVR